MATIYTVYLNWDNWNIVLVATKMSVATDHICRWYRLTVKEFWPLSVDKFYIDGHCPTPTKTDRRCGINIVISLSYFLSVFITLISFSNLSPLFHVIFSLDLHFFSMFFLYFLILLFKSIFSLLFIFSFVDSVLLSTFSTHF